jgi:competence protein ComEC
VAVSGLHVGLVVLLVSMLLAPAPRGLRVLGVVGASWLYAGLAAWTPSAVRAATLALGVSLSGLVRRQRPAPLGFALALPWLLWASPSFAGALGFRLSAAAVAGILVALDIAAPRRGGRIGLLLSPIVVSLGAQVGTLPLQLAAFGALAPLATLPNLIAIPLAGLFLPAALLAVLLPSPLGAPAAAAAALLARLLQTVLDRSAAYLPYVEHLLPPPSCVPILFALVPLLWFSLPTALRARARIRGMAAGTIVLLVAALFLPRLVPAGPWIAFLDVGQGDAAVLRLSDGSTWLVDTGDDRGPGDGARRAVIPFLRRQGIRRVSGLVISHRHRDHVGALASLLEGIEVERVFDAGYGGRGGTSGVVDSLLAAHRLWPCLVAAGDTLHRSNRVSVVALGPPRGDPLGPPPGHGLNDASLVVRVVDGAFRAVLAGDAEEAGESACVGGGDSLAAAVLKVGHHGSSTSTHPVFLREVSPRWAVISCGEGNRFGHPDPEVVARLEESGARILRTDRDGAIRLRIRGTRWEVRRHPPLSRWEPNPLSVVGDGDP